MFVMLLIGIASMSSLPDFQSSYTSSIYDKCYTLGCSFAKDCSKHFEDNNTISLGKCEKY